MADSNENKALSPIAHSWLSNPLDWPHIDRMILLALMVMIIPISSIPLILIAYFSWPGLIVRPVAMALMLMHGIIIIAMLCLILAAFHRRRRESNWPLMEIIIIVFYFITIFFQTWLSGTHLSLGALYFFLAAITMVALGSLHLSRLAYFSFWGIWATLVFMEASGMFRYAPLFTRPPYHPDGSPLSYWFFVLSFTVTCMIGIVAFNLKVFERWRVREDLYREMSSIDGLTRLTNRSTFIERCERELSRAHRNPSSHISCIIIDIDHFKSINDTYGHPAGDAVLVRVAKILMDNVRTYDEIARYGGEEFVALLPSTMMDGAVIVAERQRAKIAETEIVVDGNVIRVTASFGVASYPSHDIRNINELLNAADAAMYDAKKAGRNRVVAAAVENAGAELKPETGSDQDNGLV